MFSLFSISSWLIIVGKCISSHSFLPDLPSVHTNSPLIWKRGKKTLFQDCIHFALNKPHSFKTYFHCVSTDSHAHLNISIERG